VFHSTLFNSHKTAKYQNTLAADAVHRAITDEAVEEIL
jgi:hypothetical protein